MSDLVSKVVAKKAQEEVDNLYKSLDKTVDKIGELNTVVRAIEFDLKGSKTIVEIANHTERLTTMTAQLATEQKRAADVAAKLERARKAALDADTAEIRNTRERIKLMGEEGRAAQQKSTAEKQAAREAAAEKKRIAAEERELNRLIAAEEKVLAAQSRAEHRQAIADRKQADRDYQNTWKHLLDERDAAERELAFRQKKEAADAVAKVAIDSNVALARTLRDLQAGYDRLTRAEKENVEIGGVVAARINQIDRELKSSEFGTGRFQRNVGNYASGFNSLRVQLGFIAGELPNLQYGFRTFFSSLSNQFQGFIQAMRDAVATNQALRAEGKPTVSVAKQIAGAIFSWQTALLALVAVGPMLYDFFFKGSKSAQDAEKANEKYRKSLESIAESSRSTAQEEIAHIKVLTTLAADTEQSTRTRTRAVKELQDTYPAYFGNLSKEAILHGSVTDAINESTKALLARAAANAAEKMFAAASERVYALDLARKKAAKEANDADIALIQLQNRKAKATDYAAERIAMLNALTARSAKAQDNLNRVTAQWLEAQGVQATFLADAQKNAKAAGDAMFSGNGEKQTKRTLDLTNETIKSLQKISKSNIESNRERIEAAAATSKAIFEDEEQSLTDRLHAFEDFRNSQIALESLADSERLNNIAIKLDKIEQIEQKAAMKRTSEEKRLLLEKAALLAEENSIIESFQFKRTQVLANAVKTRIAILKSEEKQAIDAAKKQLESIESNDAAAYQQSLAQLNTSLTAGEITVKEYNQRRQAIEHDYHQKVYADQVKFLSASIEILKGFGYDTVDLENKLNAIKNKQYEDDANNFIAQAKRKEEAQKKINKALIELGQETLSALVSISNAQTESRLAKMDAEIEKIDDRKEKEIAAVNASFISQAEKEEKIAAIEAEADGKRKQIEDRQKEARRKQAAFEKASTIAQIILKTAQAVVAGLVEGGPVLAAIYGALGAVQLAVAIATPLPQYAEGIEDSGKAGMAIVGERGPEVVEQQDGTSWVTPGKATKVFLPAHSRVIPNHELLRMSNAAMMIGVERRTEEGGAFQMDQILAEIKNSNDKVVKAIKSKESVVLKGHNPQYEQFYYTIARA